MTRPPHVPSFRIAAVVSDVDGTLVTDEKLLTERTKAAVAALHARGITFSIISSRPPRGLLPILTALGITKPFCAFNGGEIVARDLSVITKHVLSPQVARHVVEKLMSSDVQPWVFAGQDWLARDSEEAYVALEERTVGFPPIVVESFEPFLDRCEKIVGVSTDFDRLVRCEHDLRAAFSGQVSVARSQPQYLDVTHPLANKGLGLLALSKLLAIPATQIVAIGDGGNDIAMFEQAGFSIAMGNGSSAVQAAADVVTASNRDDGFAHAIERFIFGSNHASAGFRARVGVHG
jgi:Cof subfamily protein (haloacid dehalogenase superfamily)